MSSPTRCWSASPNDLMTHLRSHHDAQQLVIRQKMLASLKFAMHDALTALRRLGRTLAIISLPFLRIQTRVQ